MFGQAESDRLLAWMKLGFYVDGFTFKTRRRPGPLMPLNAVAFLVFEALWFVPFYKVFQEARFSVGYALLALIPIVGPLICIWILYLCPWPLKKKLVRTFS